MPNTSKVEPHHGPDSINELLDIIRWWQQHLSDADDIAAQLPARTRTAVDARDPVAAAETITTWLAGCPGPMRRYYSAALAAIEQILAAADVRPTARPPAVSGPGAVVIDLAAVGRARRQAPAGNRLGRPQRPGYLAEMAQRLREQQIC